MFGGAVEVVGNRSVNDSHAALVAIRGGVGEVSPVFDPHDESDVRGVAMGTMAGDGADVTVLEMIFGCAHSGLRNVINWQAGDLGLDFPHGGDE